MASNPAARLWACAAIVALLSCPSLGTDARTPEPAAEAVLVEFLAALSGGDFEQAARLYGGTYGVLENWNPDLDPDAVAGLWERGCTRNGLQCLELRRVVASAVDADGTHRFEVELSTAAGELFVRGPCCDEDPATSPPDSVFTFTVEEVDGELRVMRMPPYVP